MTYQSRTLALFEGSGTSRNRLLSETVVYEDGVLVPRTFIALENNQQLDEVFGAIGRGIARVKGAASGWGRSKEHGGGLVDKIRGAWSGQKAGAQAKAQMQQQAKQKKLDRREKFRQIGAAAGRAAVTAGPERARQKAQARTMKQALKQGAKTRARSGFTTSRQGYSGDAESGAVMQPGQGAPQKTSFAGAGGEKVGKAASRLSQMKAGGSSPQGGSASPASTPASAAASLPTPTMVPKRKPAQSGAPVGAPRSAPSGKPPAAAPAPAAQRAQAATGRGAVTAGQGQPKKKKAAQPPRKMAPPPGAPRPLPTTSDVDLNASLMVFEQLRRKLYGN